MVLEFQGLRYGLFSSFLPAELQHGELSEQPHTPVPSVKHFNLVLVSHDRDLACGGVVCSSCNCRLCGNDSISMDTLTDGGKGLAAGGWDCIGRWG